MTRFGGMIDPETLSYSDILRLSTRYEELGFSQIAVFDHFYPVYSRNHSVPLLECWTILAALTRDTKRIKLGPHVTSSLHRHPGVVAKMASTVDHLSNGRLVLGLGAGWYGKESEAFGTPFAGYTERLEKFEEFTVSIKSLLTDPRTNIHGRYFSFSEALNFPKPLQDPHPPFLIGAQKGSRRMLEIISKHADIANVGWNLPPHDLEAKFKELAGICREVGRYPGKLVQSTNVDLLVGKTEKDLKEKIRRTQRKFSGKYPTMADHVKRMKHGLIGTPGECAEMLDGIKKAGAEMVYLQPLDLPDLGSIELFADCVM